MKTIMIGAAIGDILGIPDSVRIIIEVAISGKLVIMLLAVFNFSEKFLLFSKNIIQHLLGSNLKSRFSFAKDIVGRDSVEE